MRAAKASPRLRGVNIRTETRGVYRKGTEDLSVLTISYKPSGNAEAVKGEVLRRALRGSVCEGVVSWAFEEAAGDGLWI